MVVLITHVSAVSTSAIPTLPSSRSPLSSVTLVSKSEHACRIRRTQKHTSCELSHAPRHSGAPHRIEARRDEKAVTTGWRLGATPSGAETSEEVLNFAENLNLEEIHTTTSALTHALVTPVRVKETRGVSAVYL